MRALVIHEMYEVLRRHSATVRFQHGAPPDIIGTTHISPPQCVKPPAIPRFVPSFFTPARDLRAQIHLPCRRERLPFLHPCSLSLSPPSLSLLHPSISLFFSFPPSSSFSLFRLSPSRRRRHPTRRRRDDCTSLPVKFSVEYGGHGRDRETNRSASCRRHGVQPAVKASR